MKSRFSSLAAQFGIERFPLQGIQCVLVVAILLWVLPGKLRAEGEIVGHPLMRTYAFEEIGNASPGVHFSFDINGQLWLVQEESFLTFDNKNWRELKNPQNPGRKFSGCKEHSLREVLWFTR